MDGASNEKSAQPVTITAPPAAQVTGDPQNPLPEPSFLWRRVLAYLTVIAALALAGFAADALHDLGASDQLLTLSKWVIGLAALLATYYYIAPSAAELTNMIQSAKIIRSSLNMAASADKNATDAAISADNNASRPDFPAAQRDSGPPTPQDSRFPEEAPGAAPAASPDSEIDYAPTSKRTD